MPTAVIIFVQYISKFYMDVINTLTNISDMNIYQSFLSLPNIVCQSINYMHVKLGYVLYKYNHSCRHFTNRKIQVNMFVQVTEIE